MRVRVSLTLTLTLPSPFLPAGAQRTRAVREGLLQPRPGQGHAIAAFNAGDAPPTPCTPAPSPSPAQTPAPAPTPVARSPRPASQVWNAGSLAYFCVYINSRLTIKTGLNGKSSYGNMKDVTAALSAPPRCTTTTPLPAISPSPPSSHRLCRGDDDVANGPRRVPDGVAPSPQDPDAKPPVRERGGADGGVRGLKSHLAW